MGKFAIPSPYTWDESFATGVAEMDEQHKGLFNLIDAVCKSPSDDAALQALIQKVVDHFKCEEGHMGGADDAIHQDAAALTEHKGIHQTFVKTAGTLAVPITDEQQAFVKEWLVDHIKGYDIPHYGKK